MGTNTKTYWKGLEQLKNDPAYVKNADKEFVNLGAEEDPGHSRRDFLKMMGFSVAAVTAAACEAPVRMAIPLVNKPMDADPGIPNYYASTYINGGDYCSILVKTREGRPIKIDGNALSSVSKGGTSAQVEASVLSLYDDFRLRGPKIGDAKSDWASIDKEVIQKLGEVAAKGGRIRIVSDTILSPSTKAAIEKFRAKYPTTQHVQYDPASYYGVWKANEASFGSGWIPSYDFSKAMTIVSFGADFLGTWLSPIEFTKQYAVNRTIDEDHREMSRHYQFESNLSLTGANADYREMMRPSQSGLVVAHLYNLIAAKAGKDKLSVGLENAEHIVSLLTKAAEDLWATKGSSLVVSGSNDKSVQTIVNGINDMLGSYGSTILPGQPVNFRQGNDETMAAFMADAEGGKIDAVIFYNCNPVYDHPMGTKLAGALKNMALTVSTGLTEDETGAAVTYKAPDHHYLESWNDFEPKKGIYSLSQPAITPIFKSRQAQESFLVWAGESNPEYYSILADNWKNWFHAKASGAGDFQSWWDKCVYEGVYEIPSSGGAVSFSGDINAAASAIGSTYHAGNTTMELAVFESYGVGTGAYANNPLLQELPDPITKVVWDHPVTISQRDATALKITNDGESNTQFATLKANGVTKKVPVLIQPGQAPGTIGISLGYGRTKVGKVAENLGTNAYEFLTLANGSISFDQLAGVTLEKVNEDFQLAQTQTHATYMGRHNVIQESTLDKFKQNPCWKAR